MSETFLIRTTGGPHPGTRFTDDSQYPWPLPDRLGDDGGFYRKIRESGLPAMPDDSHVIRGAEYEWVEVPGLTPSS